MKHKRLPMIIGAIILAVLAVWRMLPHPLEQILPFDSNGLGEIRVQVTEFSAPDHSLDLSVYAMEIADLTGGRYEPLMDIIKSTDYRGDFRNLLPWDIMSVSSGRDDIVHSASIILVSAETDEKCIINFHGERTAAFDFGGDSEFRIYHPTNREMLSELAEYVKENGEAVKGTEKERDQLIEAYIDTLSTLEAEDDLVVAEFGDDAWENAAYTLTQIEPVEGETGYREIATGRIIEQEEYDKILRKYWEDAAKKEGVSYGDIFLVDGEPAENISSKRTDLLVKYGDNIPVELVTISDTQTYQVSLSFHGEAVSDSGFKDFHFVIDNKDGEWRIFEGLSWTEPYPESPIGD